ncbi:MAG: anti-sigma factor antagonist [Myxococcales bacterium]|nr:anti-sigma factor antagonist [Myxococcales bacterium]
MAPRTPKLTERDRKNLREYWDFYEALGPQIQQELRNAAAAMPEWGPILRAMTPKQLDENDRRSQALQRTALVEGDWEPYLADLATQGGQYALAGITFTSWFEIIAAYRETIRNHVIRLSETDFTRAMRIGEGMNRMIDIAMAGIGEAYLATKEHIISQQQEAIRELSLPILQIRERLLIVPLVGLIDSQRARTLTETLLIAIRDRRARGVVMDITGVPMVDTAVANHLVQATEAARLMGATVIITGIAAEIAQTLVGMGARLLNVRTVVDLQDGLEEIERVLGYRDGELSADQALLD